MADIWFWNSIATRKRSPSDGFLENGLAILKGYLEQRNHYVKVIDWQKNEFYNRLCPNWFLYLNRLSTIFLFWLVKRDNIYVKLYFPFFNALQDLVTLVRRQRMKYFLRKLANDIIANGIKIFGIKVWYGEAFRWSDWLANYIKQRDPSILIIAGGFHVTLYEEDFLKNSLFDLGVVSEGEKPLAIILDIVENNIDNWDKDKVLNEIKDRIKTGELKNMVYREKSYIKLTERYIPQIGQKALPKYEQDSMDGKLKIHVLLDSLGCPWGKCYFCVHQHFYYQFYPRPVENIISEIEYMVSKGVGLFRFAGSETTPGFGIRIAKGILEKGLNIRYSIGCRAINKINDSNTIYESVVKDFEIMLNSGLRAIFIGGETGNDVINERVMNKGLNRIDIIKTAKAFKEAQRRVGKLAWLSLALIYPVPLVEGITMEEVFLDDLKLIDEVLPDSVIVSPCTPFKQTTWFKEKDKFGFKLSEGFIEKFMRYEYVLYKPPSLWPPLGKNERIQGMSFKECIEECERLRKEVEKKSIPSDLTDECFLMIEGAGYLGREGLRRFKRDTSIDLISSDYRNLERITQKTNLLSEQLSKSKGEKYENTNCNDCRR